MFGRQAVLNEDAARDRLAPVRRVARTRNQHLRGLLRWFESRATNALLEGFSSLDQAAKGTVRGCRNPDDMATMIYLRVGELDRRLPEVA